MKLFHDLRDDGVHARLEGELETASCTCLRNFWELRLAGHARIELDLSGAEVGDGQGVAELVGLVRDALQAGRTVVLRASPQIVAHNLYRVGLLTHPGLTLHDTRQEEPYGG